MQLGEGKHPYDCSRAMLVQHRGQCPVYLQAQKEKKKVLFVIVHPEFDEQNSMFNEWNINGSSWFSVAILLVASIKSYLTEQMVSSVANHHFPYLSFN